MSTNMELITSVTVGSGGAASVTLPATGTIPATYTDLYVLLSARSNRSADTDPVNLELNGSTANDTSRYIEGDGSSASSGTAGGTQTEIARIPAANATASTFGNASIYIPNYAGSNYKSSSADAVTENNGTTAFTKLTAGLWSDTTAVTTIRLVSQTGNSFVEGSTFYLYGISNVTSTTKATGGIVSSDGTYNYHMFPFSGTFTPTTAFTADILTIAGGGAGSSNLGGGGGAGGLLYSSSQSLTTTAYTVAVGAGGTGGTSGSPYVGTNGGNSSVAGSGFTTLTATGGGAGGAGVGLTSGSGGSSGGNRGSDAVGTAVSGQGNVGANSSYVNNGGGGGGANTAGSAGNSSKGGNGGDGKNTYASFANATQTGVNGYYAGGGGGAGYGAAGATIGFAGLGGATDGAAVSGVATLSAVANTGSGSGGGWDSTTGNGGSGVVIIRYAI